MDKDRHGSPTFYALLEEAAKLHDKKSHDYASNKNPYGNYHFAGMAATMFAHSSEDAGFIGRIAEKIYRLANLEKSGKIARNESVEDTEKDLVVLMVLWMADRRDRRMQGIHTPIGLQSIALDSIDTQRLAYQAIEKEKGAPSNQMSSAPRDTTDGQIVHMLVNRMSYEDIKNWANYFNSMIANASGEIAKKL